MSDKVECAYSEIKKEKIGMICDAIKELLIYKNTLYGNSALDPIHIFSKEGSDSSILIRLDDKLSRIRNYKESKYRTNDICDIIGYLILLLCEYDIDKNAILNLRD